MCCDSGGGGGLLASSFLATPQEKEVECAVRGKTELKEKNFSYKFLLSFKTEEKNNLLLSKWGFYSVAKLIKKIFFTQ